MDDSRRPKVLQVYLDEPGGGSAHVDLLRDAIENDVEWHELTLGTEFVRGLSLVGPRVKTAIRGSIAASGADIVHGHGVRAAIAVALARPRIAMVATLHGLHAVRRSTGISRAAATAISRSALRRMDLILCLGKSDLALAQQWKLHESAELRWIHAAFKSPTSRDRGKARAQFGLPPRGQVILWMGRFDDQKDPLTFVHAVARVAQLHDFTALMAGDGPLLELIMDTIRRTGLSTRIRTPGWSRDPSSAYAASDIFVSTSRWEGFPLVGLEAASSGLRLILTDTPGNRDLVDVGLSATLVGSGDVPQLAGAMREALADAREENGHRQANVLSSFSVEALRMDVLGGYEAILQGRE